MGGFRRVPYQGAQLELCDNSRNIFENIEVLACPRCHYGFGSSDNLTEGALLDFYSGINRTLTVPIVEGVILPRPTAQAILARMFRSFKAGDRILDIGASTGGVFRIINLMQSGLSFYAVEPYQHYHPCLKSMGAEVSPSLFNEKPLASLDGRQYHYVFMSHVLEHFLPAIVEPVLRHVWTLLAEDGIFVCEVPHVDLSEPWFDRAEHLDGRLLRAVTNNLRARRLIAALPKSYQLFLRRIKGVTDGGDLPRILGSEDFAYGGNRVAIRVVASKSCLPGVAQSFKSQVERVSHG